MLSFARYLGLDFFDYYNYVVFPHNCSTEVKPWTFYSQLPTRCYCINVKINAADGFKNFFLQVQYERFYFICQWCLTVDKSI